jgi:hypothetical protein
MELNVSVLLDLDVSMVSASFNQPFAHQTHSIMVLNVSVYQDSLKSDQDALVFVLKMDILMILVHVFV